MRPGISKAGLGDRIRYFAALAREDAPERWTTAEAYVLALPDADPLAPSDATATSAE